MSIWPAPASAATQEWEHVATTVLAAPAATVSVTGIDTTYRKFRLMVFRIQATAGGGLFLRFNNDTGTNYSYQNFAANGASLPAARVTGSSGLELERSYPGVGEVTLNHFEASKPAASSVGRIVGSAAIFQSANIIWSSTAGEWSNTADLISRMDLYPSAGNFAAGTRVLVGGARDSV